MEGKRSSSSETCFRINFFLKTYSFSMYACSMRYYLTSCSRNLFLNIHFPKRCFLSKYIILVRLSNSFISSTLKLPSTAQCVSWFFYNIRMTPPSSTSITLQLQCQSRDQSYTYHTMLIYFKQVYHRSWLQFVKSPKTITQRSPG